MNNKYCEIYNNILKMFQLPPKNYSANIASLYQPATKREEDVFEYGRRIGLNEARKIIFDMKEGRIKDEK